MTEQPQLALTEPTAILALLIVTLIEKGLLKGGELTEQSHKALTAQRAKSASANQSWIGALEAAQRFLGVFDAPRGEPPAQASEPPPGSAWH